MKVLYVGHVFEDSGYGRACRNYVLALDAVGVDVVIRPIIFNRAKEIPKRILELCEKSTFGCETQIQFLLPEYTEYDGRFKRNIAIFEKESIKGLKYNGWSRRINLFDEVWVPNVKDKEVLPSDGIDKPIFIVGHPDEIKINNNVKLNNDELESTFTFYFIGEMSRRKNLTTLLKAFHLEFRRNEPVSLLLKINKPETSKEELYNLIDGLSSEIKRALKLYRNIDLYKKEVIITDYLPEDGIAAVHNTGDCFVSTSYGEAWQFPAFEAAAYGNEVIAAGSGPREFLPDCSFKPETKESFCFGAYDTLPTIHTGRETWEEVDARNFGKLMRKVYDLKEDERQERKIAYREKVKEFSFEKVGNLMKGLLQENVF